MKTKLALAFSVVLLALASTSQAGWGRCGGWGGGWAGPRVGWSAGWGGGYCGPRWGWGGWGPGWGVAVAAPVAVYRPVYYAAPVYTTAQPVVYTTRRTVVLSASAQSQLVIAQTQLAKLGYYRGQVDGSFGPLTCKAIAQYQADNGLRVTGRLDRATLKALGA